MSTVTHVLHGVYRLSPGEEPRDVASKVYGDGSRYHILIKHNPDWVSPVTVPNKAGRTTIVRAGEEAKDLVSRMFPNQPVHLYEERYRDWNASILPQDIVGESVFVPER